MKITIIGLGIMGKGMANNLIKNGVDLTVFNRSKEPVRELEAQGAKAAISVNEAVAEADIVFTMLSTPEVVQTLMLEENGGLYAMKKNAVWVDCTTVDPAFTLSANQVAQQAGIRFMDAPVTGTKPHAESGNLTFFVGAEKSLLEEVTPYFNMMGQKINHVGETGKGSAFKILLNLMLAQSMIIFSEAVLLGQKLGLDRDFLLDNISKAPIAAPFTQFKTQMIKSGEYEVNFPLELMHKDIHLATQTAYALNQPLYLGNLAKELFASAKQEGMGRLDFAAIHKFLEEK